MNPKKGHGTVEECVSYFIEQDRLGFLLDQVMELGDGETMFF